MRPGAIRGFFKPVVGPDADHARLDGLAQVEAPPKRGRPPKAKPTGWWPSRLAMMS